jgi:hypothetical protein
MKKQNKQVALQEVIALLETKKSLELEQLKEQLHLTYQSIHPLNLIKDIFKHDNTKATGNDVLLDTVIGMATGFLSKKIMVGSSHNIVKQGIGTLLEFVVANSVSKHTEIIKQVGGWLLNKVTSKKKMPEQSL